MTVRATANARALGSQQAGAIQSHSHALPQQIFQDIATDRYFQLGGGQRIASGVAVSTSAFGSAETRPRNLAYHPRIHA